MSSRTLPEIIYLVESALADAQKGIAKFREKLDKNPAHAFDWANGYFHDAVRIEELTGLVGHFDRRTEGVASGRDTRTDEEVLASLATYYHDMMVNQADRISSSSSATRNLMDDYRRAYKVTLYKLFDGKRIGVSL
jgi:hypothetical protein